MVLVLKVLSSKEKTQIRTIETLHTIISVENTPIRVDPMTLYERLTTLIKHEHENVQQFVHELTSEPTSLFTDGNMRKSKKSILYWRLALKNPWNLLQELALSMEEICCTTWPGFYPVRIARSSINASNIHLESMTTVVESSSPLTDIKMSAQSNAKSIVTGLWRG